MYAEPWNQNPLISWISFVCGIVFVALIFPAYYGIDKCFNNKQYDKILEQEEERKKPDYEETDWLERRNKQDLSINVRTSDLSECCCGISHRKNWPEVSKHYTGSVDIKRGIVSIL